jgi:glutaredoxin
MNPRLSLAALLLAALALPAAGQVYKWTDRDGRVHFGDRPPPDAKTEEVRIRSHEGTAEVKDWSAVIRGKRAPAASSQHVTMYATQWCGVCKRARAYFAANGIRYTEIDVDTSEAGLKEFRELGGRGVPLILVGDKVMKGFSPEGFERLRKRASS